MSDADKMEAAIAAVDKLLEKLPKDQADVIMEMMAAYDDRIDELEEGDFETMASDHEDAINRFLDVVDRPVGTQVFTIPQSGETNRAIIALHDAIGRKL